MLARCLPAASSLPFGDIFRVISNAPSRQLEIGRSLSTLSPALDGSIGDAEAVSDVSSLQ